jgi:polysaccharide deacetylase family protein (PEP-CTERM system associated)
MQNAFTVDVEDYFQVSAFEKNVPKSDWCNFPHRVMDNTLRMLDLLAKRNVHATFFVLGWVAEQYPDLVRRIVRNGHELASHSYWHRLVYEQSPEEFRQDLRQSKRILEDISGVEVTAYRAPSFSIIKKSLWALDILVEEGFRADSSIFPTVHDRYGIPGAERTIHCVQTKSGSLWEFPPSVRSVMGVDLPVSGGGYFRAYPYWFSAQSFRQINNTAKRPFMFYVHPWEIDPDQMRMEFAKGVTRFRHYVNLKGNYHKLEKLLAEFQFTRMNDVISGYSETSDSTECASPRNYDAPSAQRERT